MSSMSQTKYSIWATRIKRDFHSWSIINLERTPKSQLWNMPAFPGNGQDVEEVEEVESSDTTTDDDDSDGSESEESGIDDDLGYLTELRDELRAELLERQQVLEAKRAEHQGKMKSMARKIVFCYGQALRLNPGPAAIVLNADGGAGVQQFGGVEGDGHDQIQDDQMQDELEGFIQGIQGRLPQGIDLTMLARAMARARRSPFYATELERYRQRYQGQGLPELMIHVFTFVSTMEHHGLAPPGIPPRFGPRPNV